MEYFIVSILIAIMVYAMIRGFSTGNGGDE
jgi:hypothetical protein